MISNDDEDEEDVEPLQLVDVTHDDDVDTDQDDPNNFVLIQNSKLPTQHQCEFCQQFFKSKLNLVQVRGLLALKLYDQFALAVFGSNITM